MRSLSRSFRGVSRGVRGGEVGVEVGVEIKQGVYSRFTRLVLSGAVGRGVGVKGAGWA